MAFFGNNTTPGSGSWYDDNSGGRQYQCTQLNTGVPACTVTDVYVYCGGHNATPSAKLCIWDSSGNLVWNSSSVTLPSNNSTVGGQQWIHVGGLSVALGAGSYYLGFWANGHVCWTFESANGVQSKFTTNPASTSGESDEYGGQGYHGLGAYAVYQTGTAPSIGNITPNHGVNGDTVVLTGSGFTGTTSVTFFNGVNAPTFTINSDTQLTVTVPGGAQTGNVTVTNPSGSDTIGFIFTTLKVYKNNTGSADAVDAYVYDGSAWQLCETWVFDGSAWQQIG